jgi:hypothetical protein
LNEWRKAVGAQLPVPNPAYDAARVWEGEKAGQKGKQKGAEKGE